MEKPWACPCHSCGFDSPGTGPAWEEQCWWPWRKLLWSKLEASAKTVSLLPLGAAFKQKLSLCTMPEPRPRCVTAVCAWPRPCCSGSRPLADVPTWPQLHHPWPAWHHGAVADPSQHHQASSWPCCDFTAWSKCCCVTTALSDNGAEVRRAPWWPCGGTHGSCCPSSLGVVPGQR